MTDLQTLTHVLCLLSGVSIGLLVAGVHAQLLFLLLPPPVEARVRVITISEGD